MQKEIDSPGATQHTPSIGQMPWRTTAARYGLVGLPEEPGTRFPLIASNKTTTLSICSEIQSVRLG